MPTSQPIRIEYSAKPLYKYSLMPTQPRLEELFFGTASVKDQLCIDLILNSTTLYKIKVHQVQDVICNYYDSLPSSLLPEVTHEQEEPDSAFEATQYFFEDITPETSIGAAITLSLFWSDAKFSYDLMCFWSSLCLLVGVYAPWVTTLETSGVAYSLGRTVYSMTNRSDSKCSCLICVQHRLSLWPFT